MPRRKKKNKRVAPATVMFSTAINENDKDQSCMFAICTRSDMKVGPIWGHNARSLKRVLATLSEQCDCPAERHTQQETYGAPGHPFHF